MALQLEPASELIFDDTPQSPARTLWKFTNGCDNQKLAYRIQTTNARLFLVRPKAGILDPGAFTNIVVILLPHTESDAAASARLMVMATALDADFGSAKLTAENWNQLRDADIHKVKLTVSLMKRAEQVLTVTASLGAGLLLVEVLSLSGITLARLTLPDDAKLANVRQEIKKELGFEYRYRLIDVDGKLFDESLDGDFFATLLGITTLSKMKLGTRTEGPVMKACKKLTLLDVQGLTLQGDLAFNGSSKMASLKLTSTRKDAKIAYRIQGNGAVVKSFLVRPHAGIVECGGSTTVQIIMQDDEKALGAACFIIMATEVGCDVHNRLTAEQWSCLTLGDVQLTRFKSVTGEKMSNKETKV